MMSLDGASLCESKPGSNASNVAWHQPADWLVAAYPQMISRVEGDVIHWRDGETMPLGQSGERNSPPASSLVTAGASVMDQLRWAYPVGAWNQAAPCTDPGRIRCEPFFKKMYGETREMVESNLVPVRWMPKTTKKTLRVTRINGVADRVARISAELDRLPGALKSFVCKPAGGFNWRMIDGTSQLSPHAFGIAIDINVKYGDYWRWDLDNNGVTAYKNRIPEEVVSIFERHGFIWGGKWRHYDTMHFEYRPELLMTDAAKAGRAKRILFLSRGLDSYGAERQLGYLINGLHPERFVPFLVHAEQAETSSESIFDETKIKCVQICLRPWRKATNIIGRYLDALRLLKLAREQRIDLIHCSYQWLLPYALFIAKKLKIPVVAHIRRPNNSTRKLLKLGCAKCDALIAISMRIKRELQSVPMLRDKVHLVPDAVDLSAFREDAAPVLRDELRMNGKMLFGMVARVYKSKRQLDFVKAAKLLLDRGYDAGFVLVGRTDDENYKDQVHRFVFSNDLSEKIKLIGHRDDMTQVLSSLDVLVSLAGGSVMYEAMAIGRVVISAGFTRPEDSTHLIHEETALVSESKDIGVLVSMMERVICDRELRRKLERSAREWTHQHLSTELLIEKTKKIYDDLLD
jgi:glycosyltransferase involved in cell wall biosynthesis